MFEQLNSRFAQIIKNIKGQGKITEQNISTLSDVLMLDEQVRITTRNYIDTSLTQRTVSKI